jgi:hypothetical protein
MAPTSASRHHTFDCIELAAPDTAAANAFYGGALGSTFTDS